MIRTILSVLMILVLAFVLRAYIRRIDRNVRAKKITLSTATLVEVGLKVMAAYLAMGVLGELAQPTFGVGVLVFLGIGAITLGFFYLRWVVLPK